MAMRVRGIGLMLVVACGPDPAPAVERVRVDPDPATMLCIPEPEPGAPLRGRPAPGGWWSPSCSADLLIAPCELGPACSSDGSCSCRCEHDGDCREMAVGVAEFGGPIGRSSECINGRCIWGAR